MKKPRAPGATLDSAFFRARIERAVAVRADDTEETLAARVIKIEHRIYPQALKLVAEDRVAVENGRCSIDGAPVPDAATLVPSA